MTVIEVFADVACPFTHVGLVRFVERRNACAYAVFIGTHTGTGGPCAPTGRSVASD